MAVGNRENIVIFVIRVAHSTLGAGVARDPALGIVGKASDLSASVGKSFLKIELVIGIKTAALEKHG